MIIDVVSDLHGHRPKLDGGDLLIIAGDFHRREEHGAYLEFQRWLNEQRYGEIILIAGNHDTLMQDSDVADELLYEHTVLLDSGTTFKGLKIWGSPWSKTFDGMHPDYMAYTFDTEEELAKKWELIPSDTDILITHSPPFGVLDEVADYYSGKLENVGSKSLTARLHKIPAIEHTKPFIHVFGHIHEGHGKTSHNMMQFINASIMDLNYKPSNKPTRIEL